MYKLLESISETEVMRIAHVGVCVFIKMLHTLERFHVGNNVRMLHLREHIDLKRTCRSEQKRSPLIAHLLSGIIALFIAHLLRTKDECQIIRSTIPTLAILISFITNCAPSVLA